MNVLSLYRNQYFKVGTRPNFFVVIVCEELIHVSISSLIRSHLSSRPAEFSRPLAAVSNCLDRLHNHNR